VNSLKTSAFLFIACFFFAAVIHAQRSERLQIIPTETLALEPLAACIFKAQPALSRYIVNGLKSGEVILQEQGKWTYKDNDAEVLIQQAAKPCRKRDHTLKFHPRNTVFALKRLVEKSQ
jgi:hypothetical protein